MLQLRVDDAGELLTLQRAAYVTEAQLNGDCHLPPLTQTLVELVDELQDPATTAFGIRDPAGRLVAAVRIRAEGAAQAVGPPRAEVRRLAVVPDRQGQGLGTRLLLAAERLCPAGTSELYLFTGDRSLGNLRLYERHGYRETHRTPAGTHNLVHFVKPLGAWSSRAGGPGGR